MSRLELFKTVEKRADEATHSTYCFGRASKKEVPGSRIVAVCDRDRTRAEQVARTFAIPAVYIDAEEMLRSEPLDFVADRSSFFREHNSNSRGGSPAGP